MSEQEQAGLVRYCPECGCIGEVTEGCRDCCPDGSHHFYVPEEIARQARAGFLASIYPQPREADILRSHGDWVDAHNCYGRTAGDMARHHAGIVEALAASSAPTAPAQGQKPVAVPEGWSIKRDGGEIVVQKDGLGGYVAHQDADNIASEILYWLADALLSSAAPAQGQDADLRRQRDKLLSACKTAHATLERDGDEWGICAILEAALATSVEGGAV